MNTKRKIIENLFLFITRLYKSEGSPIKIVRKYGFIKKKANYWNQEFKKGIKIKEKEKEN